MQSAQKALILEAQPIGEHIIQGFKSHGIEARLFKPAGDHLLPGLSHFKPLNQLRKILKHEMLSHPFTLLHPGTGIWADRPELQILADELGFVLIAPQARAVSLFSNKLSFLGEAEKQKIPTLVLSLGPLHTLREIERFLENVKFPIVLKSSRGLGGSGICVFHSEKDVETKLELWLEQLRVSQGEVIVFPERYLDGARIVSLAFAKVDRESTQFFPLIDVSLQSRGRKLIQFCPAEMIEARIEKQLQAAAQLMIEASGYLGVGSFEFLVDYDQIFILEGVARLNTSFRLWEKVAATHALDWQLAALGLIPKPVLSAKKVPIHGASFRIYAEDPLLQLPQPGRVYELSKERVWSTSTSVAELHFGIEEGEEIPSHHSGILAELYSFSQQAKSVFTLAQGALEETWISGSLQTNQRFQLELIQHPWVREKIFHAGFVDEEFLPALGPESEVLHAVAGVGRLLSSPTPGDRFAVSGRKIAPRSDAFSWIKGPEYFEVSSLRGVRGVLQTESSGSLRLTAYPLVQNRWKVRVGIWEVILKRIPHSDAAVRRVSSLVPGRVHALLFREGAEIEAHHPMLMIQSLGVLVPHALPVRVRVLKWKISAEEEVQTGQELAEFEIIE